MINGESAHATALIPKSRWDLKSERSSARGAPRGGRPLGAWDATDVPDVPGVPGVTDVTAAARCVDAPAEAVGAQLLLLD